MGSDRLSGDALRQPEYVTILGNDGQPHKYDKNSQAYLDQVEHNKTFADAGKNPDGSPIRPEFQSLLDPATGMIKDQYQQKWAGDINPDMKGMDAFRERAMGQGPSAWAQEALKKQGLEEQGLKNSTQQQGASAQAEARSQLASKYGLSPAAAERLAVQGQRSQMSGLQNVGFQGEKARADIGTQDEATKNQFLQALPGQENALAQIGFQNRTGQLGVNQQNIQNSIAQTTMGNAADLQKYHDQLSAWGAGKSADAMQGGGGGKK